jgi:hypothetical protein
MTPTTRFALIASRQSLKPDLGPVLLKINISHHLRRCRNTRTPVAKKSWFSSFNGHLDVKEVLGLTDRSLLVGGL